MRTFRLYPEERHWWSFQDYEGVLSVCERLRPRTALEFGPGSSSLALVEGGCVVDTCEDKRDWFDVYSVRLAAHPITFHYYDWSDPVSIPALNERSFDLALIDGPQQWQRPAAIRYCLERCDAVLVPTEGPPDTCLLRPHLDALAAEFHRNMEILMTGPLSTAMALLTRNA